MQIVNVDTYEHLTEQAVTNPFSGAPGVDSYGADASTYHGFMMAFYGQTPVVADIDKLSRQISSVFLENQDIWSALYSTVRPGINPVNGFIETEDIQHGGTDGSSSGGSSTDATNTYDNATLRDTGRVSNTQSGTVTYGHTVHTDRVRYDGSPITQVEKYRDMVERLDMTEIIIRAVLSAITQHIYIPPKPAGREED